ncbi:hypothetical protein NLX83_11565 [Allokutzneria sp. A3M-2-11 16]|uniref:hypothetical protein n=1 Tax=Allokutzneria sp. A3M-2-11 16 TaxID=2962043 RepID=UPI0020B8514F|nr:hypothetical protein [Allokutzneria sp. A3M-2-11 16]MCP3799893.1 hypothetical protein [Allokutzneria sp. A3M-2-11 16]
MSSDALFGPDGTQAPPPPRHFPDALSAPAEVEFAEQPRIPVRPPGPPDAEAVQRALEEALAAERAPTPRQRPRQKRQGHPQHPQHPPVRPPLPPMPPPPQAQPLQQAARNSGCGLGVLIFVGILLLGFIMNVAENLFP